MNENLDLTKILEGCPKGTKFYSSNYGDITFFEISPYDWDHYPIRFYHHNLNINSQPLIVSLTKDGRSVYGYDGECTLFPSKTQRDWSKFERFWDKPKVEKFDINTLQPFDKVLVRDYTNVPWTIDFFSYRFNKTKNIRGVKYCWVYCIPYNDDTKQLLGTSNDCPEYYKWWEEE